MLDFSKLRTPAADGDVLVEPSPTEWIEALRVNRKVLQSARVPLLGSTLAQWRSQTRERIVGRDDRPIVTIGHQPDFIHAGVWAKHVVARRFADAIDGDALNLIVDTDSPRTASLAVPLVKAGGTTICRVTFSEPPAGRAFEQMRRISPDERVRIAEEVKKCLADRYTDSLMSAFLDGLGAELAQDWVDQCSAGRRAVDTSLGFVLDDRRVSRLWWAPFLRDVLSNVERFAASYNRALAGYRREHHIRGARRPIPDLAREGGAVEVPFWAYRRGDHRRRVFASRTGVAVILLADQESIGRFHLQDTAAWDELASLLGDERSWRLRPRALALTLWARLFLADLFLHGIGGAKYDRISDAIIADYYGLAPPQMVCVSATLRLASPHTDSMPHAINSMQRSIRDLEWNPQRHLSDGGDSEALKRRRASVVLRSAELRERSPGDRIARREAFEEIRRSNQALLATRPGLLASRRAELNRVLAELPHHRVALDREYFYALHSRAALDRLAGSLPHERDFGV